MEPDQQPQEPAEQLNSSAPVSGRAPRPCCRPGCFACTATPRTPDPRRSCHNLLTSCRRSRPAGAATAVASSAARAAAAATAGCSRCAHCSGPAQLKPWRICGRPAQCGRGVLRREGSRLGWCVPAGPCASILNHSLHACSHVQPPACTPANRPLHLQPRPQVHFYCKEGFELLQRFTAPPSSAGALLLQGGL